MEPKRELPQAVSEEALAHRAAPVRQRAPRFAKIKRENPMAYKLWTPEEDQQLRRELAENLPIAAIAKAHNRPPSAIRSRSRRLAQ